MTATVDEPVGKIGAFAQTMADLHLSGNQKIAISEALVAPEVMSILENSSGAQAHDALAHTLLFDVMRDRGGDDRLGRLRTGRTARGG